MGAVTHNGNLPILAEKNTKKHTARETDYLKLVWDFV